MRLFDSVRECLYPGMWLTAFEPVSDPQGTVVRVRITGCGWIDRLKELEQANGNRATAVELLRDQLKQRRVFAAEVALANGAKADGVRIESEREEADGSLRRFVIEAALAPIS